MPTINGVLNEVSPFKSPLVINGERARVVNGLRHSGYDKWRMGWNGHHFAPPDVGSVLYLPGVPGFGSTIFDYSWNFSDSGIDTDEALDASETGIDCDADASSACPVGSIINVEGELMKVTGTGVTLTVIRGYHGSTPATHDTNKDIFVWVPNNGTIIGATWKRLSSGIYYLDFDGIDDQVDCGTDSSLDFVATDFSLELCVKETARSVSFVAPLMSNLVGNTGIELSIQGDLWVTPGALVVVLNGDGGTYEGLTTTVLTLGAWYYIAITYAWATKALETYINGLPVASLTSDRDVDSTAANFNFGIRPSVNVYDYNGGIALPLAIPQLRTPQQVQNRYNQIRHLIGR